MGPSFPLQISRLRRILPRVKPVASPVTVLHTLVSRNALLVYVSRSSAKRKPGARRDLTSLATTAAAAALTAVTVAVAFEQVGVAEGDGSARLVIVHTRRTAMNE